MATYRQPLFGGQRRFHEIDPEMEARQGGDGETAGTGAGSLLSELIGETTALMRAEISLARNEMQDNLGHMQRGVGVMAAGAGVLAAGLLALLAAVILALAPRMQDWVAALIVGSITALCGLLMLMVGKRKATTEGWKPYRTLGSFQDMRDLARQEKQRATRKWR
jgi:hypothetical protein